MLRTTYYYASALLESDRAVTQTNERTLIKQLGTWLGLQTFAKNRPVLIVDMDLKVGAAWGTWGGGERGQAGRQAGGQEGVVCLGPSSSSSEAARSCSRQVLAATARPLWRPLLVACSASPLTPPGSPPSPTLPRP